MSEFDDFRVFIDDAGHLRNEGRNGFIEPICPVCDKPIAWVLDMMSFKHDGGSYVACHAHCVWTGSAFSREARLAQP